MGLFESRQAAKNPRLLQTFFMILPAVLAHVCT